MPGGGLRSGDLAQNAMADSVEDLTGTCWRDDMWLQCYGIHPANVLDYFGLSPFYDRACNNEIAKMRNLRYDQMTCDNVASRDPRKRPRSQTQAAGGAVAELEERGGGRGGRQGLAAARFRREMGERAFDPIAGRRSDVVSRFRSDRSPSPPCAACLGRDSSTLSRTRSLRICS